MQIIQHLGGKDTQRSGDKRTNEMTTIDYNLRRDQHQHPQHWNPYGEWSPFFQACDASYSCKKLSANDSGKIFFIKNLPGTQCLRWLCVEKSSTNKR